MISILLVKRKEDDYHQETDNPWATVSVNPSDSWIKESQYDGFF